MSFTFTDIIYLGTATPGSGGGGGGSGLPDQTGQSGKFLTTDGTDASWATISALQNTATSANSLTILGSAATVGQNNLNIGQSSSVEGPNSTAVGVSARSWYPDATALGYIARADKERAIAIGSGANVSANGTGTYGIAIGYSATVMAGGAIQIGGNGRTNSEAGTLCIGSGNNNYKLLDSDGTIPTARLTKANTTVTLAVADWSSSTQTVSVTGVTATSIVFVAPDSASQSDYTSAGILCTAQGAGTLTFTCSTTPTNAITVNVVAL